MMINYFYQNNDSFAFQLEKKIGILLDNHFVRSHYYSIIISSLLDRGAFLKSINISNSSCHSVYAVFMGMGYIAISPVSVTDYSVGLSCIQCFSQKVIAHFGHQDLCEYLMKIDETKQEHLFFKSFLDVHIDIAAKILCQQIIQPERHHNQTLQLINLYNLNYKSLIFHPVHKCKCRQNNYKNKQDFSEMLE